jgi:hypothetical protein
MTTEMIRIQPFHNEANNYAGAKVSFLTRDEDKIAAFPKYCGAKAWWGITIELSENGVNGGKNERGIKRLRKIVEVAQSLGILSVEGGMMGSDPQLSVEELIARFS